MKAFSRAAILYATVSLLGSVIVGWKLVDVFAARPRVSLPSYGHVPAFRLVDHRGQPISDESLRGTVWVADFIFTRCAGQCPMMSERLAQLDHALGADARLKLISFTVDPDWDTPKVLAEYATAHGAAHERWLFVTGPKAEIWQLCAHGFQLAVSDGERASVEPITHSTRLVLVDASGAIRGYYDAAEPDELERLQHELHVLLGAGS